MKPRLALLCALSLAACGGDGPTAPADADAADADADAAPADAGDAAVARPDTSGADSGPASQDAAALDADAAGPRAPIACGTGGYELLDPAAVTTLEYHDGVGVSDVASQAWTIDADGVTYALADGPAWEATRFELAHPARVHGFALQWARLPDDPDAELVAGLYPDFGYNGFDFVHDAPLWRGTRCAGEAAPGAWLEYIFERPVEVAHPGLVYVAQRRADADAPGLLFDGSAADDCAPFDACPSAINLPAAASGSTYAGVSFPFSHDFMIRLYVEYTDAKGPDDKRFRPLPDLELGARVAWGDFDGDGDDDLLTQGPTLLDNDGAGGFTDVTIAAGLDGDLASSGGIFGDYDNDGCLDLFLFADTVSRGDTLLRNNCDGTFTDVTAAAGLDDTQGYDRCGQPADSTAHGPSPAATWVDLDADGLLDLYVANFICWATETYYSDDVYLNQGDGTFNRVSGGLGFDARRTASRGATAIDHDRDGDLDVFVNNYRLQPNLFFDNHGDGSVTERGVLTHLAGHYDLYADRPYYGHSIGVAWGDLDNDGDFDVVEANLAHPRFYGFSDKTRVLLNDGAGVYTDRAADWAAGWSAAGLRYQETASVPALADFDADGALDLVITAVYDGRPTDFYWGRGDGTFSLDTYGAGVTTEGGWGVAVADMDGDGDVDLAAGRVFENVGDASQSGAWLSVAVVGDVAANRAGLGATVEVRAGARRWLRHVQGGTGQGCQDSRYLHFGLGELTEVDELAVTFPGGRTVRYAGPYAAGQRLWLYESGAAVPGWAPPPGG